MRESAKTNDTTRAARTIVRSRLASMSLGERLERLRAVTLAANRIALAGVRMRNPSASEGELLLELARLRLGRELTRRVYGTE
jgi:hypothetical protein